MKNYCDIVDASSLGFGINEDFLKYRTSEFNAISFARYHIAESILNAGKSLTYIDIDCVVKNNFESDILSKLKTQPEHLHIQVNLKNKPCTGFFALTPAFDSFILNQFIIQQKPRDHDQHFLWNLMETHNIKLNLLDNNLYPNGLMYYSNHQKIDDQCYIIHFNCVQGEANKINKIKQFGYWYLS